RDAEQHVVGCNLFYHAAGLHGLAWIIISFPRILICAKHAAGNLAIKRPDQPEIIVSSIEVGWIFTLLKVLCRLAKTLGDVHVMPIRKVVLLSPVRCVAIDLRCKVK